MGQGTEIGILITIFFVMISVGVVTPLIEAQFSPSQTSTDVQGQVADTGQETSPSGIVFSIAGMFFWDFGQRFITTFFPLFIFFTALKLGFYVILFRVISDIIPFT